MARTKGSGDLFKLIHSLSTEEKGYFKKFARRHTSAGNKYLQLFDMVNRQKDFEENSLKKKFESYPMLKIYLFDMIVHSLVTSGSGNTPYDEILTGVMQVNQLVRKGLTVRAIKAIRELQQQAADKDMYIFQSLLIKHEIHLSASGWKAEESLSNLKRLFKEARLAERKQHQIDEMIYQGRIADCLQVLKTTQNIDNYLAAEIDIKLLESTGHVLSPYENRIRLNILAYVYHTQQEHEKGYKICCEIYEWEKKRGHNPKSVGLSYLGAVTNYIQFAIITKRLSEAERMANILITSQTNDENILLYRNLSHATLLQRILWYKGNHDAGEAFSARKEEYFAPKYFAANWHKAVNIISLKALFEFSNGHYTRAFNTLNFFNSSAMDKYSSAERRSAELFKPLLQLEMLNDELVIPMIKSVQKRIKDLNGIEKDFLNTVKANPVSGKQLWRKLAEGPAAQLIFLNVLRLKDLAESKLTGKSLAEIVNKNYIATGVE